jgi:hypothetical protein
MEVANARVKNIEVMGTYALRGITTFIVVDPGFTTSLA